MKKLVIGAKVIPSAHCLTHYSTFYNKGEVYVVESFKSKRKVVAHHKDGRRFENAYLYDGQWSGGANRMLEELFTLSDLILLGGE